MTTFADLLSQDTPVFLDGATGSQLQKRGMPTGVCPELWIMEHPDVFTHLVEEYMEAGSQIIYAPTFTANRVKLDEYGLGNRIHEINQTLVSITRNAARENVLVAADIAMTGKQLVPMGDMEFETLIDVYKEQIRILADAGVDLIAIETMMSLQETRAAVIAAKEVCDLPILATLSFESDGRTLYGTDAVTAAIVLEKLGVSAVGTNCSTGPVQMQQIIRDMAEHVQIPVIAKPNAGLPSLDKEGNTVYNLDEAGFVEGIGLLLEAGASFIGGCCGTSPSYIKAIYDAYHNQKTVKKYIPGKRFLTSERVTFAFGLHDRFRIVGERINPTGKKKLQAALRDGNLEMVQDFAEEQEACGAAVLDINMGMSGIDEKEMLLRSMDAVSEVSQLPLSLDTSHVEVMEAALRRYPGRALMNSISLETAKCEPLLKLAKKYGAMFILLPLSDQGLPGSNEEKMEIIETVRRKAHEYGLSDEDIIVDGLVATVGANPMAALETLDAIRYCKEQGLATICGLSNISFGLPERSFINSTFLTMAIQSGLTLAIANPSQEMLVCNAYAADLLLNKPGADVAYIELMNAYKEAKEASGVPAKTSAGIHLSGGAGGNQEILSCMEQIRKDVLKGNRNGIVSSTKKALEEGHEPKEILDRVLLPAINEVGDLFDRGTYFLPQLIGSAETMKNAIEILEPLLLTGQSDDNMPVVVLATVEGDIHDIGKNLVALMLKNYGFKVIDLGKDVSKETIVQCAIENKASVIALSALMTTTMQEMKHVVDYAREKHFSGKIIIGGAVITQDYADEIGADGYSKDAADAVKVTKALLQMNES